MTLSADGKRVAAVSDDDRFRVWDLETEVLIMDETHADGDPELFGIDFGVDGDLLATTGADSKVKLWRVSTSKVVGEIIGHTNSVYDVKFSPDGTLLATASADSSVKIWDLASLGESLAIFESALYTFQDSVQSVRTVGFSPDGRQVIASGIDQAIRRYPLSLDELIGKLKERQNDNRTAR